MQRGSTAGSVIYPQTSSVINCRILHREMLPKTGTALYLQTGSIINFWTHLFQFFYGFDTIVPNHAQIQKKKIKRMHKQKKRLDRVSHL